MKGGLSVTGEITECQDSENSNRSLHKKDKEWMFRD